MRRSPSLNKLQSSFEGRIVRLQRLLVPVPGTAYASDRRVAYASIEAVSAWSAFVREYYLSCACFRAKTTRGASAAPAAAATFASDRDAILYSIQTLKPPAVFARAQAATAISPRDEPTWHDPSTLVRLDALLNFGSSPQIATGLSYPTTFFRDGPPVRNFFAHRNKDSHDKVGRIVASPPYSSTMASAHLFLASVLPGRSQPLVEEWLDDLRLISFELCY